MGTEPSSALPEGYVWLTDDTGAITVAVPDTWTDIDTTPETDETGAPAPRIAAAPDLEEFRATFDVPGVEYIAAPYVEDPEATIEEVGLTSGCAEVVVEPYEDPVFTGFVQVGTECGATGEATWNFVVASPEDHSFTAFVQVQTATAADDEALQIVLDSFNIAPAGAVPGTSVPSTSVPGTDTMVHTTPVDTGMTETTETA
jgi:serine protease Do